MCASLGPVTGEIWLRTVVDGALPDAVHAALWAGERP
jgi:hypothetical protein